MTFFDSMSWYFGGLAGIAVLLGAYAQSNGWAWVIGVVLIANAARAWQNMRDY